MKPRLGQLRDDLGSAGHHPTDADHLVDVGGVEVAHGLGLAQVEGADLHGVARVVDPVDDLVLENLVDDNVEHRDDLLRVDGHEAVELRVEGVEVLAVEGETLDLRGKWGVGRGKHCRELGEWN